MKKGIHPRGEKIFDLFGKVKVFLLDKFRTPYGELLLLAVDDNYTVRTWALYIHPGPGIHHLYIDKYGVLSLTCDNPAECSEVFPHPLRGEIELVEITPEGYNFYREAQKLPPIIFPTQTTLTPKALYEAASEAKWTTHPTWYRGPKRPSYFST